MRKGEVSSLKERGNELNGKVSAPKGEVNELNGKVNELNE